MKKNKPRPTATSLGEFPRTIPALERAQRVTERASDLGFDWPEPGPVWKKVEEELTELRKAFSAHNKERVKDEMGDLFFSLVNLSRFLEIEAEETLHQTTDRFLQRFAYVEKGIKAKGKSLAESSLEEMDALWEEAKKREPKK